MKAAACFVLLALSLAFGGILAAELVVLPGLEQEGSLLDSNLAKSVAAPLHTRLLDLVLTASFLLVALVPKVATGRAPALLSVGVAGLALLDRVVVVPALYEAWSRCDLVAGRPLEALTDAEQLATQQHTIAIALGVLLIALTVIISRQIVAEAGSEADLSDEPEAGA